MSFAPVLARSLTYLKHYTCNHLVVGQGCRAAIPGAQWLAFDSAIPQNSFPQGAVGRSFTSGGQDTGTSQQAASKRESLVAAAVGADTGHGSTPAPAAGHDHHPAAASLPAQHLEGALNSSSASTLQRYISAELVTDVSSTINKLTGYETIDRVKATVAQVDEALTAAKRELTAAKLQYDQQLAQQGQLHREVTALLQRKSSWVPADVSRFTELYAAEHATEKAVATAKAQYTSLSDDVDLLQLKLVDLIRERYQQEQAWSDKIRRASTWWTWGLMGLHFASFVAVYTILEPRKRQALTAAVAGMLEQHTARIDHMLSKLAAAGTTADATGSDRQQGHKQAGKTHRQHQQGSSLQEGSAAEHLQASTEVQERVLQELDKVQQQLQQLQQAMPPSAAHSSAHAAGGSAAAGRWWPLGSPGSRQWVAQQAAAAGSAAATSWQAVKSRVQQLPTHFNPLQALRGSQQAAGAGAAGSSESVADSTASSSGVRGAASGAGVSDAAVLHDMASTTPPQVPPAQATGSSGGLPQVVSSKQQQHEPPGSSTQQAAGAGQHSSREPDHRGIASLLSHLWQGGSVVEISRSQLALLAAAASSCGAAVGAVLVLLWRPGVELQQAVVVPPDKGRF